MNIEILKEMACRLYGGEIDSSYWASIFDIDELRALWAECCKDLELGFDDEVYNAIDLLGGWSE